MAPLTVTVTGASGFLGAHYIKYTLRNFPEWKLVAQVRSTPLGFAAPNLTCLTADLTRPMSAQMLASTEPDVIVHMAAAITEDNARDINTKMMANVLEACKLCGAKLVYISSSQVNFSKLNQYAQSKIDDENAAKASGIPHTSLRPAAPYGPLLPDHKASRDQSFHALVNFIKKLPAIPVIGDGQYTRQPVHVDDFNHAINFFIDKDRFEGEAFDIGGPRAIPLDGITDILCDLIGKKVFKLHLPKQIFIASTYFVSIFNKDLLQSTDTDEVANNAPLLKVLGKDKFMDFEDGAMTLL